MLAKAAHFTQALREWHVRSQQVSRRNALVACTALAERRREHEEVEEYLRRHARSRAVALQGNTGAGTGAAAEVRPA